MNEYHKIPETDWAYLSGILDGEGCLRVGAYKDSRTGQKAFRSSIQVAMTDIPVIEWISNTFGGSFYAAPRPGVSKPVANWVVQGVKAAEIASHCMKYLKAKKNQAELLIQFAATVKNTGVAGHSKEIHEARGRMAELSTKLNAKGVQGGDLP